MTLFKLPRFVTRSHDVLQVGVGLCMSVGLCFTFYFGG